MSAPLNLVSAREFARLDGCNDKLVRNAVKAGKLPISADGKIDAALAGSGWRKLNRRTAAGADTGADSAIRSAPADKPPVTSAPGAATDLDTANMMVGDFIAGILSGQFLSLAAKNLLAAMKEAGDVVDVGIAEAVLFEQARQIRDAWMNWPARVGPLIAAELGLPPDPVVEALNKHVQLQLSDLGEPEAVFEED
jgi:hypothetical protein